jgi:hypothetical protein
MKKNYLIIALLTMSTLSMAQVELKPAIGFNITDVSKDPVSGKTKGQAGFQFGASVLIGNKFYVDPGIFWVKKSTQFVEEGTTPTELDLDMSGIRIPVAIGYHLLGNEESTAALRILGGGSAFFVTSVDAEGVDKDDFNSPAWGVFAGAGLDIWILFLDVKYEWSLTDVASVTDFDIGKHKGFFSNVGVRIKF